MQKIFTIFFFLLLLLNFSSTAQTQNSYTIGNSVLVSIESNTGLYEYTSDELLVRYNEKTQKVECIFNVFRLLPANDSSAVVIARDLFFASKYPEVLIEIDAPKSNVRTSSTEPHVTNRNSRIHIQGVPIDINIPVNLLPDRNSMLFSTSFNLFLPEYLITVPARYLPMLTGRITFTVRNARWATLEPR